MISRSLHRRRTGQHYVTARVWPSRDTPSPMTLRVTVQIRDFATGDTQSFLIMPGQTVMATVTGYTKNQGVPRVLAVPVAIHADLSWIA